MAGAAGSSASASSVAALVVVVVLVAVLLLVKRSLRRAAARREEVRRLAQLAAEESELAERESVLAYYSELFPGVVQPAEAPVWAPPPVIPAQAEAEDAVEDEEAKLQPQPQPHLPAGAKGLCAVCFRPTTFRCKQCKAVKYCSFKCQIAHWRQGHKNECHPPSDARPDDGAELPVGKEGKIEQGSASEEIILVGVEPQSEINIPASARFEDFRANPTVMSLNNKSKEMPLEQVSATTKVPEDVHSACVVKLPQNTPQVASSNSRNTVSNIKPPTTSVENGSYTKESLIDSKKHHKDQDADVREDCSHISRSRTYARNSNSQVAAPVVLEPQSSKTSLHVEVEQSKVKAAGINKIENSSIRGDRSVTPAPSKKADNVSERDAKVPEKAGSTETNLATSLKKIVRQQTAPKVVRHYPPELTLFPYELFVKLYDKVELRPFGLHNLGNSCYANAVLQCLMFTRPLTSYLLEGLHSKNCSKKEWCFMCEFEKLITEGKQGKTALSPTGILSHLHDIGGSFGPGKQEDAHEFLRYTIDAMQSVCMKEARKIGSYHRCEETTLVQLIFGGYLRSKIKCTRCHYSTERREHMLDLTVEIDGDINSLEEALQRFTSTEILDGDNRYQCSRCKSYERAKKKLTISEAPNVLTIALKRYQSGKFGKISKAIRFPETLNLSSYMNSTTDDISPVYSLYAVVVHHDVMNAAFSGHYVCYVKDTTQGKWYKTDDSQVKQVSLENVMSKCAYMLLYARCSPRAPSSVRKGLLSQDPARVKPKQQINSAQMPWQAGGSMNRHQGGRLHTDQMTDDLSCVFDEYGGVLYPPAESPSPSESSSLFSNSDAGSHSTVSTDSSESTRISVSEEYEYYLFGNSDQLYPGGHMVGREENNSRSRSGFGTSSSGQESDHADCDEKPVEHRLQGPREGWVQGDASSSLYTERSKQHFSSKLTEQYRLIDGSEHDPGEARGSVLMRRPARERTTRTFY